MLNRLVKFLSVVPWMALVPQILRFRDLEDLIIAALHVIFPAQLQNVETTYSPIVGYFL